MFLFKLSLQFIPIFTNNWGTISISFNILTFSIKKIKKNHFPKYYNSNNFKNKHLSRLIRKNYPNLPMGVYLYSLQSDLHDP